MQIHIIGTIPSAAKGIVCPASQQMYNPMRVSSCCSAGKRQCNMSVSVWVQSLLGDKREETQNPMYVPIPYMWNPVFIQSVQWFQPLDDFKKYSWIVNITPILLSALLNATFILLYLTVLCRPSLNSRVFSIWEILGISLAVGSIISMVTKPRNHVCTRRQQTVHPWLGNPMTQFSTT